MRINFDFTDLEAFLAVLETGSFHLASERLGLSQSSVSRRITKLEAALDSPLFHRTTREVKPTLAAKRLKLRAENILNETLETARALRDESSAFAHQRARSITVACIPTIVSRLLVPAVQKLHQDHPNIRFRFLDLAANEVAEAVAQGDADIGICSVPTLEPATHFEVLFNDPIVLAIPAEHQLAEQEDIAWADLSQEKLILPQRGTGNRMLIDDALAHAGLPLVWTLEVGRTSTALELVAAGIGIAPVPSAALGSRTRSDIVHKRVLAPSIARPVGLLTRIGQSHNALVDQFSNAVRAAAADA